MSDHASRRGFLRGSVAGAAAGLGDLSFLGKLRPVSAAEVAPLPNTVQFTPEIEPLVRLLEETPRGRLLERVAERIKQGTSYRQILAALQLAGVRNIQPRPNVGFKFHAVLVVNSAHLAAINSPEEHRWLPIFWALDYFKDSQARDEKEGDWTMSAVDESSVPPADKAHGMFIEAMDAWDVAKADVATAALARSASTDELFELFCRYGARDFRSIGHKAIFVSNAFRTIGAIGRRYAEPILRSLAYALLNSEKDDDPAHNDYVADRPGRENVARAKKIRPDWQAGRLDDKATKEVLSTLYSGTAAEVCDQIVEILNRGVAPQSIWDALFLEGGELLMRQPGIVGLHTLTATNALHYAYETAADDDLRRMVLLQNAAFLPMFRDAMKSRGKVKPQKLLDLEPAETSGENVIDEIFAAVSDDPMLAAQETLAYARRHDDVQPFLDAARVLVFLKGRDTHDYKFSSAVLEDCTALSPAWRDRYLAATVFNLCGAGEKDNPLVARTRAALSA